MDDSGAKRPMKNNRSGETVDLHAVITKRLGAAGIREMDHIWDDKVGSN